MSQAVRLSLRWLTSNSLSLPSLLSALPPAWTSLSASLLGKLQVLWAEELLSRGGT